MSRKATGERAAVLFAVFPVLNLAAMDLLVDAKACGNFPAFRLVAPQGGSCGATAVLAGKAGRCGLGAPAALSTGMSCASLLRAGAGLVVGLGAGRLAGVEAGAGAGRRSDMTGPISASAES